MLNSVEVTNSQGSVLLLPLDSEEGIIVEEIEGLDPVKATLVSSSFATKDGADYHSSRREPRNLKFKFGFEPDYSRETVRDLRKQLYNFFMPKTEVNMIFRHDDNLNVTIRGYVEELGNPLFVQDPAADISLMCFDPDFIDLTSVVFNGLTTAGSGEETISYPGTVETGFVFTLLPDRDVPTFTIYHRQPDGKLRSMDFTYPLLTGDVLKISTIVGSKYALRTRAAVEASVLYGIPPQASWLELKPGDNHIRVYAEGVPVPYTIEYVTRYGGL